MLHIQPARLHTPLPLYGARVTRLIEQAAMVRLPPHQLMQRAAEAVYRLGRSLYPHARRIWIACGPGNNGGDGLLAASLWQRDLGPCGVQVCVTWSGQENRLPDDARFALSQARAAGVQFTREPPAHFDLAVDALLGIGVNSSPAASLGDWITRLQLSTAPVLCVDLPSGLSPDSGRWFNTCPATPNAPRHTLSLLTLKPGLFTASGREAAGDIWLDDLGVVPDLGNTPDAWLNSPKPTSALSRQQRHDAHKGSHGDLQILGGQDVRVNGRGMTGAALLAARAGLQGGAGRVFVGLLGPTVSPALSVDLQFPELMFRAPSELLQPDALARATTVCGCGGGIALRDCLPSALTYSQQLVLDADALNAIADKAEWQRQLTLRHERQQTTVLTPHPLEAGRLLGVDAATIQADRLAAAQQLAQRFQCLVVLKGSGTVLALPDSTPTINPTGNALLATAGTGDVLAGLLGSYWCALPQAATPKDRWHNALLAACSAVYQHGRVADEWVSDRPFTASYMVTALGPH